MNRTLAIALLFCFATVSHAEQYSLEIEFIVFDGPLPNEARAELHEKIKSENRPGMDVEHTIAALKLHRHTIASSTMVLSLVHNETSVQKHDSNELLLEARATLKEVTDGKYKVKMAVAAACLLNGGGLFTLNPGNVTSMRMDVPKSAAHVETGKLAIVIKTTLKRSDTVTDAFPRGYEQIFRDRVRPRIGQQAKVNGKSNWVPIALIAGD